LEPVNLLILDEPTNHLDMASKDVLKEAILAFDGTAIIVSHDREFLDGLVTKVYEFGNGHVKEHLGGIYDWLSSSLQSTQQEGKLGALVGQKTSIIAEAAHSQPLASASYLERKEQQKRMKKAEKAVKECEAKIEQLEKRIKEMDALLCQPEHAADMELISEYTSTRKVLDEENDRWILLSERLEELQG